MEGEWKVPQSLAGRSLFLRTDGAPGDYRLDERAFGESDVIPLCTDCRKGQKLEILARSRGAWDALPVVVEDPLARVVP